MPIPRLLAAFRLLGFAGLLCLGTLSATEVAPLPLPGPASLTELQAAFSDLLAQPRFAGALWGVKVVSLDSGRTLFAQGSALRLSPASNCKLFTGALALDRLGGDFRIRTPLLGSGPVDAQGVLTGDLIVRGRGDPSWRTRGKSGDFWSLFDPFVAALRAAGVRRIAGSVVADATFLRGSPYGAGWTADDLQESYGAEVSALSLEDNFADLRIAPGPAAGAPCALEWAQPLTGLTLENHTVTLPADKPHNLTWRRLPGTTRVEVFGGLPADGAAESVQVTVPRPAQWFAVALRAALQQAGIEVAGAARSLVWPEAPAAGSVALGEIVSPPLNALVKGFMKPSQNLETDLLFGILGEAHRTSDTPPGRSSEELAVEVLQNFLAVHDLRPGEVRFEEGSGLSRNNLATADAFVALLQFMAKHREAAAWLDSLPVAGVDGSLRRRLTEAPAAGNLRAKTGGLRWASTLTGYVTSAAGEHLAFSFLLNRYSAPAGRTNSMELDELAGLLARYRGRE